MTDSNPTETIPGLFASQVARGGDAPAIYVRRGGDYAPLGWREFASDVRRAAAALISLGIKPGDRVILVSPNRYEWIVCDLAIQLARAVHVPVHASLSGPQIAHQIVDSGAVAVILSGEEQAEKLISEVPRFPADLKTIAFDPCPDSWEHFHFLRFGELLAAADESVAADVERQALAHVRPEDLATILYTSGTTGEPKGVMLSQRNLASNALASVEAFGSRTDDLRITWLPLSHIFARTCDLYTWLVTGSRLALAESPEAVIANCHQLQPTLINGVPYFYEKVQRRFSEAGLANKPGELVKLFGGRMRLCVSGGAALPQHVARFYQSQGLRLLQGYGLTETSPVIATESEQAHKLGTVGRPVPGVEVRISGEGEILTRGPHVMLGYWQDPKSTAATIEEGWLLTGDLGELDADGFLHITGRKKELIVTAGGKNIAPAHLEGLLIEDPLIQQVVVIGDGRNFLTALIVPDLDALQAEFEMTYAPATAACHCPVARRKFRERIERRLAIVSRYEQIGNFALLERPFSVERGELTPTLKLRRSTIQANFADVIESLYTADATTAG